MNSLILRVSTKYLMVLLIAFSIFLLFRGHNAPGGGFVGGLMAALAFVLYALAEGVEKARKALRLDPVVLMGIGLLLALAEGLWSLVVGTSFMTAHWYKWFYYDFGTPLVFDTGVYCVVLGTVLLITLTLLEEKL